MKKITDFIVKKRYYFLSIFVLLAGICLFLETKVNINDDIMKYLPKSSETKIGKDIMDKEFMEEDTSILNVMFKDLNKKEREETLKKLQAINGVSSVSYEENENYNKDNYTLYVLNVDDYDHSKTATNVYNSVKDNFKTVGMSGSIYDENKPILQLWIVILAISFAMLILIILSDSYLEPWLYLFSIGIAVFINKGTNIMFDSVSAITNSITAILQLALSMDYSIMLSNRYKQEKEKQPNKVKAMQEALYQSFKAISSSSVTTIVGLIALVFMSFTIGQDLGFVLAKGVLLSLISIFFCLPALLLMFDNLISKTKKKTPKFNLTKLGNFIYKARFIDALLIIILFTAAFFLKGNINILFTGSEQDLVGKVFPENNQIALVYNNKEEDFITKYCKTLEENEKIDEVLCYSNTINEKLAYNELNNKFSDLNQDVNIDESLIKIIYYNYFNQNKKNKMTINEFISFIKSDIQNNKSFKKKLDQKTLDNLDLLQNFTSKTLINKKRTTKDIANILNIKEQDVKNILIYYNSKNINTKMTIKEFVNFMLNDVAKDKNYNRKISKETISKLQMLQSFTDKNTINKKMTAKELAKLFGIDESLVEDLFLFSTLQTESTTKLTLNEFATFSLNLANDKNYQDLFDAETKNSLTTLKTLSTEEVITQKLDESAMMQALANLGLNIDAASLTNIYTYYTGSNTSTKLTLNEFATLSLSLNESYHLISKEEMNSLKMIQALNSNYDKSLTAEELCNLFGITDNSKKILIGMLIGNKNLTPLEFVDKLLAVDDNFVDQNQKEQLSQAKFILTNITTEYSKEEITSILNKDKTIVDFIYGANDAKNNKLKDMSLKELINFLDQNKNNQFISPYLEENMTVLNLAKKIVNNTSIKYSYQEISKLINISDAKVANIYGVYDYQNKNIEMTPLELTNFILDNQNNDLLKDKLTKDMLANLKLVKTVMDDTIKETKYTSSKLSNLLGIDKNTMDLLFSLYSSKGVNQEISLYNLVNFINSDVINNKEYASNFDKAKTEKIKTISNLMQNSLNKTKYTASEAFNILVILSDDLDKSLIDLVYLYYGSTKEYKNEWQMTIEEFVNYLNKDILTDKKFDDFITDSKRNVITDAKMEVTKAKKLLTSKDYSRVVLNTKYAPEDKDTYEFINSIHEKIGNKKDIYVVGSSPMAVEMSKTFNNELNKITILTMIFIFVVVAITFKDLIIPLVLVLIIQTAVYTTMSAISLTGGSVYFISLLIVQAILMGATIDYAIVYTSYYRESRLTMGIKDSVINAYNKSIHTIISSSTILIIVTLVVAHFASAIAAKICETISEGTLAATILILFILPGILATTDRFICRKGYYKEK